MESNFFQPDMEKMPREELLRLQLDRLKKTLRRCYDNVPLYRDKFKSAGILPEDVNSLEDLRQIPFTTKEDIRDNYPFGMFAASMREVVRVHASSGTTGKPTVVGYTKNDLDLWADLIARIVSMVGVTADDIVQIAFGYGLFTGAFGLHYGLERVGTTIVPTSSGNTERQLMLMQDFGTTVLVATPSYALYMGEVAREQGILDNLKLKIGLFGSEGCSDEMRGAIEQNLGLFATDNYGMSEVMGPGVSGECHLRCGLHIWEDHFIPEIVDPDTGQVLPEGATGELVLTSLTKEAFPILRYRTRDITRLNYTPCECGRTHVRMDKVMGRSDDMLIIRGVNVFPSQIESVLVAMEHIGPHYQIVLKREGFVDSLEVNVELSDAKLLESYAELENLRNKVKDRLYTVLGIKSKVNLVEPKSLERFQGKAKRVLDLRGQ